MLLQSVAMAITWKGQVKKLMPLEEKLKLHEELNIAGEKLKNIALKFGFESVYVDLEDIIGFLSENIDYEYEQPCNKSKKIGGQLMGRQNIKYYFRKYNIYKILLFNYLNV